MADYANARAVESDRELRFQTVVPMQMIGDTGVGDAAARAYATRRGITPETFLAGFGAALTARQFGEHVADLLADPCHRTPRAFTIKGDTGLSPLP